MYNNIYRHSFQTLHFEQQPSFLSLLVTHTHTVPLQVVNMYTLYSDSIVYVLLWVFTTLCASDTMHNLHHLSLTSVKPS